MSDSPVVDAATEIADYARFIHTALCDLPRLLRLIHDVKRRNIAEQDAKEVIYGVIQGWYNIFDSILR